MFMKLKEVILNLFFPPYCASCGKLGSFLCPQCKRKLIKSTEIIHPFFRKSESYLSGIISAGHFKDPILKEAIHKYKYEGVFALVPIFSKMIAGRIKKEGLHFDIIMFVPTTKKRGSKRGYNQSELLAKELAKHFKKPLIHSLSKIKDTKTQVGLTKKEREKNLKSAFAYKGPSLKDKSILLIDDVATTGSTLNECARVLRKKGARDIWGAVIATEQ